MTGAQDFSTSSLPQSQVVDSDLLLNPMDSEKTLINQKLGKPVTDVDGALVGVGGCSTALEIKDGATASTFSLQPEITCEGGAPANSRVLQPDISPIIIPSSEVSSNPPATFAPSIGAWAKPLAFALPDTPPTPATPMGFDPQYLNNLLDSFWPTLADGIGQNQKKRDSQTAVREFPRIPAQKIPVPELKDDGTLRFPWAARMNPSTRNLYRAAKPTFRLDGTPQVTIPSQVISLGPENREEYVIGQFHRCTLPPEGLIHAVVNRLWGRTCRIGCRKISESSYMFHIPHVSTRQWVVQRGVWHVDDCLLFVSPWKPVNSLKVPEVSTIPVWVNLKNVPDCCYSRLGLSHVASGLGEPMQTHKPRLDPTSLGEAKLLVEVELDKPFPKQIALDDKKGNIFLVDVEYTWIPSVCGRCGHLGHKEKRCLLPVAPGIVEKSSSQEELSNEVPETETEGEQAHFNIAPDMVVQAESSKVSLVSAENEQDEFTVQSLEITNETNFKEKQTQECVEQNGLSTPTNIPTYSKVTIATGSNSHVTSMPLAGTPLAPTQNTFMEGIPSPIIVSEPSLALEDNSLTFNSPSHDNPSSNQIDQNEQDDGNEIMSNATASFNMSRGGRPIKPFQKYQDMDWTTTRGKGKRGRRGRGYHNP